MDIINFIIGKSWGQRIIILGAAILYAYLFIVKPNVAKKGVINSFQTFTSLLTLIIAALLISQAIGLLIPEEKVSDLLGEGSGLKGITAGGLLAGLLQGGPYAVYPIIKSLYDKGAHISVVMAMLMGYGAIGIGRVAYGLIFFGPKIVGLRLLLAIPVPILAGLAVLLFV
ncbi:MULTISPECIES: permease [unclassified Halanaerobium]|uniref:permease n=1 Tax=unclassified Halanaerobium TaxID=2641197 RepID=UPI000DF3195C|nr:MULTISPECIES: permease [unclassified Halanaerobium]RCW47716.1 putative permease [Halanaerobium sp. MA284_MarDTE_T2]RCW84640.1 putative permease [Halanaerobium sp. DL-01]